VAKPVCKLPRDDDGNERVFDRCGTVKGVTLCAGDRVTRLPVKDGKKAITFKHKGTVLGVGEARTNRGKKELAARVCFDNAEAGDLAYSYFFDELKKVK
jgi:hypothetical protein